MNYSENGHSSNNENKFSWKIREDLSDWIRMVRLDKGAQVYTQGEPVEEFYLLKNGLLGLYKLIPPNKSILIGTVQPGQTIGITQMLLNDGFPAHVRAIKGSILLQGDREDLSKIQESYPNELTKVLLEESVHYSSLYERIQQVLSETVEQKIARELLELAEKIGRDTQKGLKIVIGLTRKEISDMVGCTHESASRVMSQWEKEGTISTHHKNITLLNLSKLRGSIQSKDFKKRSFKH